MSVPQINIGSIGSPYLNISQFPKLPIDARWGNLTLKFMKIVQRLDYVNKKLFVLYRHFEELKLPQGVPYDISALESEEVVYWLRKTIDEFIQLLYLGFYRKNGHYPTRIEVDNIDALLQIKPEGLFSIFSAEQAKLAQLRDVSNAYKHSFLNAQLNAIGRDEPLVLCLSVKRNDLDQAPKYNAIALRDFVSDMDRLYPLLKDKCIELFQASEWNKSPPADGDGGESERSVK